MAQKHLESLIKNTEYNVYCLGSLKPRIYENVAVEYLLKKKS